MVREEIDTLAAAITQAMRGPMAGPANGRWPPGCGCCARSALAQPDVSQHALTHYLKTLHHENPRGLAQ